MGTSRRLAIAVCAAALAALAFVLWPAGSDESRIERTSVDGDPGVAVAPPEGAELAEDAASQEPGAAADAPVASVPGDDSLDGRRDVGGASTWSDVLRPIAARGRVALTEFDVAVFAADGTRRDFAASDGVPAGEPAADALVCVLADGLCPRFVRGERLGPDVPAREREVVMVPRAALSIAAETASPWFVTPRAIRLFASVRGVANRSVFIGIGGERPVVELAESLVV